MSIVIVDAHLAVFDRSDLIMFMAFKFMLIVSFLIVIYRYFDKFQ